MSNALNPFQSQSTQQLPGALAQTDQSRAIAEVQASLMIARSSPRDEVVAMDRILNACTRPSLAENAVYQYARGGNDISGPSIRLAETIAQQWGNINFGVREISQIEGESVVQSFAWDLEHNCRREMTFTVPHVRWTKQGKKLLTDPRDIYEMVANQGARRLRACILAVIPGDVTEAAVQQCELTLHAKADTSPDAMTKMIEAFSKYGVTKEQLETRIQRRLDAIQPAQVVALKKIYASLRDGMSKPSEWFDIIKPIKSVDDVLNQSAEPKPAATGQQPEGYDHYLIGRILDAINTAKTLADIAKLPDLKALNPHDLKIANAALNKKNKQLKTQSPQAGSVDWKARIEACEDRETLELMLSEIPEVVQIELTEVIDLQFDQLR